VCFILTGAGKNRTVTVTRGKGSSSLDALSYDGPTLTYGTLRFVGQPVVLDPDGRAVVAVQTMDAGTLLLLRLFF